MKRLTLFLAFCLCLTPYAFGQYIVNPYENTDANPTSSGGYVPPRPPASGVRVYNPYTSAATPSAQLEVAGTYTGDVPASNILGIGGFLSGLTTTAAVVAQTAAQAAEYVNTFRRAVDTWKRWNRTFDQFRESVTQMGNLEFRGVGGMLDSIDDVLRTGQVLSYSTLGGSERLVHDFRNTFPVIDHELAEAGNPYEQVQGYMQGTFNTISAARQHAAQIHQAQRDIERFAEILSYSDNPMQIAETQAQLDLYQVQESQLRRQAQLMQMQQEARWQAYLVSADARSYAAQNQASIEWLRSEGLDPAMPEGYGEPIDYEVGGHAFDAQTHTVPNQGDGPMGAGLSHDEEAPGDWRDVFGEPPAVDLSCPEGERMIGQYDTDGDGYYDTVVCEPAGDAPPAAPPTSPPTSPPISPPTTY